MWKVTIVARSSLSPEQLFNQGTEHEYVSTSVTDLGNVSQEIPCIFVCYCLSTPDFLHSQGFTSAAGTDDAHQRTVACARALALTLLDVLGYGSRDKCRDSSAAILLAEKRSASSQHIV